MTAIRLVGIALLAASGLCGQDAALAKLVQQAERLRIDAAGASFGPGAPRRLGGLHAALRDWIESRLPAKEGPPQADVATLQAALTADLRRSGLSVTEDTRMSYGYIGKLELSAPKDTPDLLTVVAGVTVPCGADEAVYVYRFAGGARTRVLEDHPDSDFGLTSARIYTSAADSSGRRLLVTTHVDVQCSSASAGLHYSVFRLSGNLAALLGAAGHPAYLEEAHLDDPGYEIALKPDEFTLEFRDRSIDSAVDHRTMIFRYRAGERLVRIDPVALSPRDFVEEWMENPLRENESKAAPDRKKLEEMHRVAQTGFLMGDFDFEQSCGNHPGEWQIGISSGTLVKKKSTEPLQAYFLVRETGKYRYEMTSAAMTRQPGCAGNSHGSADSPWLTAEELKALQ
jgi:hypothetical protein